MSDEKTKKLTELHARLINLMREAEKHIVSARNAYALAEEVYEEIRQLKEGKEDV